MFLQPKHTAYVIYARGEKAGRFRPGKPARVPDAFFMNALLCPRAVGGPHASLCPAHPPCATGHWAGRIQPDSPSPAHHVYLHDPVPVVASGDLEEREEGHAEILEGGVPAHALTRVLVVADWKESGVSLARCRVPCRAYPVLLPLSLISDTLEAAQGAPRDPRRDSRGERSPWLPLETRPDSPGEPGMQPRKSIEIKSRLVVANSWERIRG